ncbi:MAG: hypothetical protein ACR2PX_20305 [Endozoicomonas sp.]|uniref:hypothetical protein n=1 Tax=Endozoicomonas sp. TaxID=1892382 RepID=UPI003D9BC120
MVNAWLLGNGKEHVSIDKGLQVANDKRGKNPVIRAAPLSQLLVFFMGYPDVFIIFIRTSSNELPYRKQFIRTPDIKSNDRLNQTLCFLIDVFSIWCFVTK